MHICNTKWKIYERRITSYKEPSREWTIHHTTRKVFNVADFIGHAWSNIDINGLEAHGRFGIHEKVMRYGFCRNYVTKSISI